MTNFLIIFICFALGILFQNVNKFPKTTNISINLFVIYVSLPALILLKFPMLLAQLKLEGNWWVPVSMAWLTFLISGIFIIFLGKKFNWSRPKLGALILCCGLGNTSFVGFPILEAIIGKEAIPIGILADQPGSFFIVSTLGIFVAALYAGENPSFSFIFKRIFTFPPFLAMIISIFWFFTKLNHYGFFQESLEKISQTLVPLSLFAVGFQTNFKWSVIRKRMLPLSIGLLIKLFILPVIFYFFYIRILGINDLFSQVAVLESAMATQITAAVVVSEFNLDTEIANLMVGISIPLSLFTVPFLNFIFFK